MTGLRKLLLLVSAVPILLAFSFVPDTTAQCMNDQYSQVNGPSTCCCAPCSLIEPKHSRAYYLQKWRDEDLAWNQEWSNRNEQYIQKWKNEDRAWNQKWGY